MNFDLIHDRGRGPEIIGTRVTVYNLLPHLLNAAMTEEAIGRLYDLSPEQVAVARAYVLNHADTVFAEHLKIEARMSAGNPPAVIERAKQVHAAFVDFKHRLARRSPGDAHTVPAIAPPAYTDPGSVPTFRESNQRGP